MTRVWPCELPRSWFFIPNATDVTNHTSGAYAIVLRNSTNAELFRYPFDPDQVNEEDTETTQFPTDELAITELVPYTAGTTRVDIEAPGGVVLGSITAGINNPTVGTPTVGTAPSWLLRGPGCATSPQPAAARARSGIAAAVMPNASRKPRTSVIAQVP